MKTHEKILGNARDLLFQQDGAPVHKLLNGIARKILLTLFLLPCGQATALT
jgi:hypothetical protein